MNPILWHDRNDLTTFHGGPAAGACLGIALLLLTAPLAAQCPPHQTDKLLGFGSAALDGDRLLVSSAVHGVHVFDKSTAGWIETAQLTSSDGAPGDLFGGSVSLSGNRALVGAPGDDDHGPQSGSAYVFEFDGTSWIETAKLTAQDGEVSDQFGWSVAIQGDRAVVGMPFDDGQFSDSGSAYVFEFDGMAWAQTAKLTASDGEQADGLAAAMALSGDLLLLGAYYDDDNGPGSGSAYIFQYDAAHWTQGAKLLASDGAAYDAFGTSVALRGERALVGALGHDAVDLDSGCAYVFERTGSGWVETKLVPADGRSDEWFGYSVALSRSGALVGARNDSDLAWRTGSAYIFRSTGWGWPEVAEVHASDAEGGDWFGSTIAADAVRFVVAAPGDDELGNNSGSVYVFELEAQPGVAFCSGDGSLSTDCPCAPPDVVPDPPAATGHGCANPLNPAGTLLFACGTISPDGLRFFADVGPDYGGLAFMVKGDAQNPNGIASFDGVRCVSGRLIRFGSHTAGTNGDAPGTWSYPNAVQTLPVSVATGQPAGQSAYYQLLYRSAASGFCNPSTANWSNGYQIVWQ